MSNWKGLSNWWQAFYPLEIYEQITLWKVYKKEKFKELKEILNLELLFWDSDNKQKRIAQKFLQIVKMRNYSILLCWRNNPTTSVAYNTKYFFHNTCLLHLWSPYCLVMLSRLKEQFFWEYAIFMEEGKRQQQQKLIESSYAH